MTLQHSYTETVITLEKKQKSGVEMEYYFEGQPNEHFHNRIFSYLQKYASNFPVLEDHAIRIDSTNSFPHSTGIASSASAFGALTLTLLSASGYTNNDLMRKASYLSRLGSGSACRSMFGGYALWGKLNTVEDSSDEYAIPVTEVHSNFMNLHDAILIVDDTAKSVSSSKGHSLMEGHHYAQNRFDQANKHSLNMLEVLKHGEFKEFVSIIEREALALHAMMMTSDDYYLLMKPGTINAIEEIMNFRKESGINACFTLDAGPNVHVIYPDNDSEQVKIFLETVLKPKLKGIIYDHIGNGPQKIEC